ncbi:sigma E protease regulator RseP [Candidatus Steffania adelgidicola]|uniref:sigma E protease regulator RseP n=1 Tax=Candidatus Steffania adelgidicola TaxID=1076626 RepID=UPI001D020453|nr:sigma E protease regulator RseP [Candidatus Steffania adelgidicola]UDG80121.1 Regulator of sigma-E protease RseP [Candidatus Steffania adelgidicola]
MLHFLWNLTAFIVALGILITVHEFGHFWIARCCGVRVERFSIGFGRTLWRRCDKRGTEYIIATIPLGGYVKMLDDRVDTVEPHRRNEAFNRKSIWIRTVIIVAGPIFNFLFAIFAYWLVFLIGVPSYRPIIGEVAPNSIAAKAEISPGMEVKLVDGIDTPDWDSVRLQLLDKIGHGHTTVTLTPFGTVKSTKKTLDLRHWKFEPNKDDAIISLGIIPLGPRIEPVLSKVQLGSAAMRAGLQAGDKILTVNGQPVTEWRLFVTQIRDNPGQAICVNIERRGIAIDITLQPDSKVLGNGEREGFAGVMPKIIPLPEKYKIMRRYGLLPIQASEKTWQIMHLTVRMLGKLLTGEVKLNNLSGPLSIAQGAGLSAEYGLIYYLMFLALISINLGIINLFPLPVLDGGHLLFLSIEKLKGTPVSQRVEDFSYRIGSILLVLLMGMALFNDFCRL